MTKIELKDLKMKNKTIRKQCCEKCKKLFDEYELDMHNGRDLCQECEKHEEEKENNYK